MKGSKKEIDIHSRHMLNTSWIWGPSTSPAWQSKRVAAWLDRQLDGDTSYHDVYATKTIGKDEHMHARRSVWMFYNFIKHIELIMSIRFVLAWTYSLIHAITFTKVVGLNK